MRLLATTAVLLLALPCAGSAAEPTATMRVRLEWGGGAPRVWRGLLEIEEGRFENPMPLGIESDLPGSAWADGTALWIRRRSKRAYDGLEVTVTANPDADLRITLQSADDPPLRTSFSLPLRELAEGHRALRVGERGDRVSLKRVPGDALRVDTNRRHLVFHPSETFDFEVEVNAWPRGTEATEGRLAWELRPAGDGDRPIVEGAQSVLIPPPGRPTTRVPIRLALPEAEGVYDVRLELLSRSVRRTRRVQLIVAGEERRPVEARGDSDATEDETRLVDVVEPSEPLATKRIHGRGGIETVRGHIDGFSRMFAPQPESERSEPEWVAFQLNVDDTSELHQIAVDLDSTVPRFVGISILQPNAIGHLVPMGVDSGVHVRGRSTGGEDREETVRHVIRFRPRSQRPIVLLHSDSATIGVRRIELHEVRLVGTRVVPGVDRTSKRWLVGPLLERPLLSETFGSGQVHDKASNRSLHDWRTFESAVDGFVDHLHRSASNAAMVCVMADGSTVFPCPELEPTARFDSGILFSTGQDPKRKDVLELLLRRCDRDGLALVPLLHFNAPIPALERLRRMKRGDSTARKSIAVESVEATRLVDDRRPTTPWQPYDPTDPTVQDVVVEIVRDFANTYGRHRCLKAVAVDLGSETFLSRRVPVEDGEGTASDDGLTAFHRRIAEAVTMAHPELGCVLLYDSNGGERDRPTAGWPERTQLLHRSRNANLGVPNVATGAVQSVAPVRTRLRSFDPQSPWQPAYTWLSAQPTYGDAHVRRPLLAAVAEDGGMVFGGGWTCPSVDDPRVRSMRRQIASLPAEPFNVVPNVPQPVMVRTARTRNRTWLTVTNEFPHAVEVRLRSRARDERLAEGTTEEDDRGELDVNGESTIPLTLPPYGFEVLELESSILIESVDVAVDPTAEVELRRRLRELDGVIGAAREAAVARDARLGNPGFEKNGAGADTPPEWSIESDNDVEASVDQNDAHAGEQSLRLLSTDGRSVSALATVPFDSESRAVVSAWLRSTGEEARVRFVFETTTNGRVRRRFAEVDVTSEWKRHSFRVSDIAIGENERVRVGFELAGSGTLNVDDVSVRLARVTPERMRQLEKTFASASLALDDNRYSDALRQLEGEWTRDPALREFRAGGATESVDSPTPGDRPETTKSRSWWRLLRRPQTTR